MTFFYSLLYLAVNCSTLSVPEEYLVGFFLAFLSGMFPYVTLLGSTVVTRLASVYEAFGRISRSSCVSHDTIYEMDWQTQYRAGSTVGFSCSQLQLRSYLWCRSQSLWMVGPSLPLRLSCSRALRRQTALTLRGCMRRDVVWWLVFLS